MDGAIQSPGPQHCLTVHTVGCQGALYFSGAIINSVKPGHPHRLFVIPLFHSEIFV